MSATGRRTGLKVRRGRREGEENIVPLINIVFLLLIFFMLTGQLVAPDPFDIDPPESGSESDSGERTVTVLVAADGRLALDGEQVDAATLSRGVAGMLETDPAVRLHLKADGAADAARVVEVMETLREAGIANLTLLTAARLR